MSEVEGTFEALDASVSDAAGEGMSPRLALEAELVAAQAKVDKLRAHLAAALIERDAAAERLDEIED